MTRKEFVRLCGILGVGLPIQTAFNSCSKDGPILEASDNVIVIGAGAAGLSTAYLLNQKGINVRILEAASYCGGRMIRTTDFADFPIPLGAEWLHVERGIFDEAVNDSSVNVEVNTTPYNPIVDYGLLEGIQVSVSDIGITVDQKFIDSTWYDFFDQYIIPFVKDKISYNQVVNSIDYSSDRVLVKTTNGEFSANKVVVTVPVKMLQNGAIDFIPELPTEKQDAIKKVTVWDGCKAFIEFSEKFYPTFIGFDITPETDGQKLYYDAAYGQNTDQNILGLFAVGTGTLPYVSLTDDELIDYMLAELDAIFDGQASANYVKHLFQNWNEAPFANGAYVVDHENWQRIRTLGDSVGDQLFFAGDAYTTGDDWSSVHAAVRSARSVVDVLLG